MKRAKEERTLRHGEVDALTFTTLQLLDLINMGTLLMPANADFKEALSILLGNSSVPVHG